MLWFLQNNTCAVVVVDRVKDVECTTHSRVASCSNCSTRCVHHMLLSCCSVVLRQLGNRHARAVLPGQYLHHMIL